MFGYLKKILKKIYHKIIICLPIKISGEEVSRVYDFFCNFKGYRSLKACSFNCAISEIKCDKIKSKLYSERKLGLYYFEANTSPQKYMRKYILENIAGISTESKIVEVGPGECPLFDYGEYKNWFGVDRNYDGRQINFKELEWARDKYGENMIKKGGFENLSECLAGTDLVGDTDLVVASHVYEHTLLPIKSLKEMNKILKPGGAVVLFVPDGFTDDPSTKDQTHTLYLNKGMIEEFFSYAGGYTNIRINIFRPNADLVITAIKL